MTKKANITIKTGEYKSGETMKGRYKVIGRLMQDEKGNEFILLDSTIVSMQLNYIANKDRNDNIICSIFLENKDSEGGSGVPF